MSHFCETSKSFLWSSEQINNNLWIRPMAGCKVTLKFPSRRKQLDGIQKVTFFQPHIQNYKIKSTYINDVSYYERTNLLWYNCSLTSTSWNYKIRNKSTIPPSKATTLMNGSFSHLLSGKCIITSSTLTSALHKIIMLFYLIFAAILYKGPILMCNSLSSVLVSKLILITG